MADITLSPPPSHERRNSNVVGGGSLQRTNSNVGGIIARESSSSNFGAAAAAASSSSMTIAPQQQSEIPDSLVVLFLGKREDCVPLMIALASKQPCKNVPEEWSDEKTIKCELPIPNHEPVPGVLFFSTTPDVVHDKQPNVVVLCYAPTQGMTVAKAMLDHQSLEVRSAVPRPAICLCAVRTEKLHSHTDANLNPVSAHEACDLFMRTRAATYIETSSELGVHIGSCQEAIANAAVLRQELRPTPEIIKLLRDHVLTQAFAGANWIARRDRRTQRIFYMNRHTRKATWERPPDYDGIEPNLTEEEKRQIAAQEVENQERRARLERERKMNDDYLADVHLYEERMKSLENAFETASKTNVDYEKEVQTLRRQMSENSEVLRKLQLQYDLRVKNKSAFVSGEAERDSFLEKEVQEHRERLFEIESSLALKQEKEDDVHLTELSVENRKLASDVRLSLQKQLETQRTLASLGARSSELARESEHLTVKLMRLRTKQQQSKQILERGNGEISALRQRLGSLDHELEHIVNQDIAEASSQAMRQKQLLRAIAHAENALRDAKGSMRTRQVVDEHERLQIEQHKLVTDVTGASAATAQWELRVRRALSTFQSLEGDLSDMLSQIHQVSQDFASLVQVAVSEVQARANAADKTRPGSAAANSPSSSTVASARRAAAAAASLGSAAGVDEKLQLLHRATLHVVREANRDVLRRTQKANEVSSAVADVFDDVLSIPEVSNAAPISETVSPSRRLVIKCDSAVRSDAKLRDALLNGFEKHLRAAVKTRPNMR